MHRQSILIIYTQIRQNNICWWCREKPRGGPGAIRNFMVTSQIKAEIFASEGAVGVQAAASRTGQGVCWAGVQGGLQQRNSSWEKEMM